MKVKVKEVVRYNGHNVTANGVVNLGLKANYSELTGSVKLLQMLNNDVVLKAKIPGGKPMKLGVFRVKEVKIGDDGESALKFAGTNDSVETDNLNLLCLSDSDTKEFVIMAETEIEMEEEENE